MSQTPSASVPNEAPWDQAFLPPARKVRPGKAEEARNPRARSATLRSAVRSTASAWSTRYGNGEAVSC